MSLATACTQQVQLFVQLCKIEFIPSLGIISSSGIENLRHTRGMCRELCVPGSCAAYRLARQKAENALIALSLSVCPVAFSFLLG